MRLLINFVVIYALSLSLTAHGQQSVSQKLAECTKTSSSLEQQIKDLKQKSIDNFKLKLLTTSRRNAWFSPPEEEAARKDSLNQLTNRCIEVADGRANPRIVDFGCTKADDTSEFFDAQKLVCSGVCAYSRN